MRSNKKRKEERLHSGADTLTPNAYNAVVGGVTVYGLLLSGIIGATCFELVLQIGAIPLLIGYFISCIVGILISRFSRNYVLSFVGYNLVVLPIGLVLTISFQSYSAGTVAIALILTAIVTAIMLALSTLFPGIFKGLGRILFASLLIGVVVELVAMFLGYAGTLFDWGFILLFSLYIGYDWYKAQRYPKNMDNAIDSALDIYLDIINLFLRVLDILGKADD